MSYRADLAALNAAGELVLAVEVKNKRGTSREWATELHRNLVAHDLVERARYFLLALPDRFYLWKDTTGVAVDSPPSYEADPSTLLGPYFKAAGVRPEQISGRSFEFVIASLLYDVIANRESPPELRENHAWLFDSGLFDSLRGGHVACEVAA